MALAAAVRAASVTDTDGNEIDTAEFFGTGKAPDADAGDDVAVGTEEADGAADEAVEAEAASDE
ncbi:hypothetical protein A5771_07705 [Mycolicibacter sinensis]|uniref:Uncharacterized protein n=2 Tax=Mycolicibacter sinensis (strain JDM601) TaxID=875328 RepID=A0A1A2EMZ8_MYCSD|nr:hypothetical protein A5771_07705 [Mycolicibacter sinensis]